MRTRNRLIALAVLLAILLLPAAALAQGGPFQVTLPNGLTASFASAQGLQTPSPSAPFRMNGETIKMPGIADYGNVTLLRGSFSNSSQFWQWKDSIQMDTIARGSIVISSGSRQYILNNAWPTRINGLSAQGGTVRVERLEIAHEQLVIQDQ